MKERILEFCRAYFFKYGVRNITMDDVATQLGMSKKTIYQHFRNKEELVMAVAQAYIAEQSEGCRRIMGESEDAIIEILSIQNFECQRLNGLNPILPVEIRKYFPVVWQEFDSYHTGFVRDAVRRNLERGVAEGLYRPDINVEFVARMHTASINLLIDPELLPPDQFPVPDSSRNFMTHYLFGLVTRQGYEKLEEYIKNYSLTLS